MITLVHDTCFRVAEKWAVVNLCDTYFWNHLTAILNAMVYIDVWLEVRKFVAQSCQTDGH